MGLVESLKIIGLQQLVAELGEGNAHLDALFDCFLAHHVIDSQRFADIAQESEDVHVAVKVVIIDDAGRIVDPFEGEQFANLVHLVSQICIQLFVGLEVALFVLAGGISDAPGSASHQDDGMVAGLLKQGEQHERHVITDGHRRGSGIEPDVAGDRLLLQEVFDPGGGILEHAAPAQFFDEVHELGIFAKIEKARQSHRTDSHRYSRNGFLADGVEGGKRSDLSIFEEIPD